MQMRVTLCGRAVRVAKQRTDDRQACASGNCDACKAVAEVVYFMLNTPSFPKD
jgi:hypothetical protein